MFNHTRRISLVYILGAGGIVVSILSDCGSAEKPKGGLTDTTMLKVNGTAGNARTEEYNPDELLLQRRIKNASFRSDESPIPESSRSTFPGLSYYPLTPKFVFTLQLQRYPSPIPVKIMATKGDIREMVKFGTLSFTVEGKQCSLVVYKSSESNGEFFIPFRDATNQDETYHGGRYIDLPEHGGDTPYLLDFNKAYNPYCAYSPNYTCPIVPSENILPVAIRAGEKAPPAVPGGSNGADSIR